MCHKFLAQTSSSAGRPVSPSVSQSTKIPQPQFFEILQVWRPSVCFWQWEWPVTKRFITSKKIHVTWPNFEETHTHTHTHNLMHKRTHTFRSEGAQIPTLFLPHCYTNRLAEAWGLFTIGVCVRIHTRAHMCANLPGGLKACGSHLGMPACMCCFVLYRCHI